LARFSGKNGKKGQTIVSKLIKAAVVAAVIVVVIESLPDIKRYLELRDM
jgi:hypothetical protein